MLTPQQLCVTGDPGLNFWTVVLAEVLQGRKGKPMGGNTCPGQARPDEVLSIPEESVQIAPFLTQLTLDPLLSGQPLCWPMQVTCGPIMLPKEPQPLVPIPFSVPAVCVKYHPNWIWGL